MSPETMPNDPCLAHLVTACDPGKMLQYFQTYLVPRMKRRGYVMDCRLSRIRYRPRTRCVLQYTLNIKECDTGYEREQWVTGMIYPGDRAMRILQKIQAEGHENEIHDYLVTDEPAFFIPELRMVVQVFPYDRRIPALPSLTGEPAPDLIDLIMKRFGQGKRYMENCNIKPVRYRAGLGGVLQYTIIVRDEATGRAETKRFYVKAYRENDRQGEQTYRVLEYLSGRAESEETCYKVPLPVAYRHDLHSLIQEEAHGLSLYEIFLKGDGTGLFMRKAARVLAAFNQDDYRPATQYTLVDHISELKDAGDLCAALLPSIEKDVIEVINAISSGLGDFQSMPTHRDLKMDHLFMDGENITIIDFDSFAAADPVLDPASLLAQLAAMSYNFSIPYGRISSAGRAFVEEYFSHVPGSWRHRLKLQYAGAVLKGSVTFFRHQAPHWPEKMSALIQEAKNALGGRIF